MPFNRQGVFLCRKYRRRRYEGIPTKVLTINVFNCKIMENKKKGCDGMKKLLELIDKNPDVPDFIKENKEIILKIGAVVIVIVLAFIVVTVKGDEEKPLETEEAAVVETSAAEAIFVDVGGEVNKPSVVELDEGSRVADAIEAAGGLTEKADVSEINRAALVSDGEKIFVPSFETEMGESGMGGSNQGYLDDRININTADSEELQELTGVGPAIAERIISYREDNGRFKSIEDIKNVSGIGDKTYEKFKDDIRV